MKFIGTERSQLSNTGHDTSNSLEGFSMGLEAMLNAMAWQYGYSCLEVQKGYSYLFRMFPIGSELEERVIGFAAFNFQTGGRWERKNRPV